MTATIEYIAHGGCSMNPTLCELDLLEVCPYTDSPVRAGDVILFRPPGSDRYVVHRVVSAEKDGIRTRGDRMASVDPWLLTPSEVRGRVIAARRGSKRRRIAGGWIGRLSLTAAYARRCVKRCLISTVTLLCRVLCRYGTLRRFLCNRLRPRIVRFESAGRTQIRLMLGRRVIGRYTGERWHIDRPFNALLDDSTFPQKIG